MLKLNRTGKILKIVDTEPAVRKRLIKELNEKCEALNTGVSSGQVQIREGIYEQSIKRDIERTGPPKIPSNFTTLKGIETTKTSVRKTRDYPVLGNRFKN